MSTIDQLLDGASDKFVAAEVLINQDLFEDAVSRMFYGLLFCARALLLTKDLQPEDPDEVISAFHTHIIKKGIMNKDMGTLLKETKKGAEKADFNPTFRISEEKIREMMERCGQFMEQAEDAAG
jgi:uncharacterized protein (UPF0332 family)